MNRPSRYPAPYAPQPEYRPATEDSSGIELGALFGALKRSKILILGFILAAGLIAVIALKIIQPSYFSSVQVLLNTRQERVVGIEQVVSDLNVSNSVVAGEIAVLRSNLLLGQVVDDLDLMNNPEYDPYEVAEPGLLSRVWTFVSGGSGEPMPDAEADDEGRLSPEDARNLVIWQVSRNLSIHQSGISYVISINMRATSPELAASIANAVANQYIQDQLDAKQAATQRAISWLDNRLVDLETQLESAEDAVVDFRARQVLEEGNDSASVAQQLLEMNRAFVAARNEHASAQARLTHVQRLMAEGGPEGAAAALSTPRLANLDGELADLERERAQMATRLGPQHPEMLAVQLALEDLLRDRVAAIQAGVKELEANVAEAASREQAISNDIAEAQRLQVELSRSSVRLSQLERSASAMRQVYESFLSRFQETTQQLEFQRADARIISAAQPALSPARPRKKLILAVALTLGAFLGIAVALAREALSRSVARATDLSRLTKRPVLATLPDVGLRRRNSGWQLQQLRQEPPTGYAEGLRLLRFGILGDGAGETPGVILFTGADREAGASSTVLGEARVLADLGHKVAILDANFRHPDQATLARVQPPSKTIADYIAGNADLDKIILKEIEPGLSLIPGVKNVGGAADMLASTRFKTLLTALATRFDFVLIDAPPANGMADTTTLTRMADATVVVVRSRATERAEILDAIAALEAAGGKVLGTVLSHTEEKTAQSAAAPATGRTTPLRERAASV